MKKTQKKSLINKNSLVKPSVISYLEKLNPGARIETLFHKGKHLIQWRKKKQKKITRLKRVKKRQAS